MITKDATIREIHHRVKNNLQTVASLLRIQARRTKSDVAKDALDQAMRRVAAIAVVHDTLSEGLSQNVDFDVVFDRVLKLVAEVASGANQVVRPTPEGFFWLLTQRIRDTLGFGAHGISDQRGRAWASGQRRWSRHHQRPTE